MEYAIKPLTIDDINEAREMFALLAEIFGEKHERLSDEYLKTLLSRKSFWALAAKSGSEILGGLTAHEIPMSKKEGSEIFIYDIAVASQYRRKGIGRKLVASVLTLASQEDVSEAFVLASDEDTHAIDFYRRLGGSPSIVTLFELPRVLY